MEWVFPDSSEFDIKDIQHTFKDNEIKLMWYWPRGVEFVYILVAPAEKLDQVEPSIHAKLYTREEYKAKQGYFERIESIGKYGVRIFPCVKEDGKLSIFRQENDANTVYFATGKAKIFYSIHYKKKLLTKRKKVQMVIMSEVPLERDILCYVKKHGAVPVSIEDGTYYPFIRDFFAGNNELPEIELDKDEYIRIFFNDGKKHAHMYELIPK